MYISTHCSLYVPLQQAVVVFTTVFGVGYNERDVIVLLYTIVPNLYKSAGAAQ